MAKRIKLGAVVFGAGIIENILLLMLYNIPITKQTLIFTGLFSVILTFTIDKFVLNQGG